MPSGAYIIALYECFGPNNCYLNIKVYPLAEDIGNSKGLRGSYNGIADDDRTINGTTEQIVAFVASYV